jgi:hypothetical protein
MSNKDKAIELCKKLLVMSERGSTEGERRNARIALYKLLGKHKMKLSEIKPSEKMLVYWFNFSDREHKQFTIQVISSVIGNMSGRAYVNRTKLKSIGFELSEYEYYECLTKIDFFWNIYKEEKKLFYEAFVHKQKLYTKPDKERKEIGKMTSEQLERVKKMSRYYDSIERKTHRKQLE